jgi:peptide/nickel transport system permease protein
MSVGPSELVAGSETAAGGLPARVAEGFSRRRLWRRLLADRVAVGAAAFIVVLVLIAIFAPLIVKAVGAPGPDVADPGARDRFGDPVGPSPGALWPFIAVLAGAALASASRLVPAGTVRRYGWAVISGVALVAAIVLAVGFWPDAHHIFGVDKEFRDLFSRILYGARLSLEVAVIAAAVSLPIGVALGLGAGRLRGRIGAAISRLIDALFALPILLLALGIAATCKLGKGCLGAVLHPGLAVVIVVIALVNTIYTARATRNEVIAEMPPDLFGPVAAWAASLIAQGVLYMAALSYLGIGVQFPRASWGAMLADANSVLGTAWWYMLFPGAALLLTVLAFNLLGDGLREALKPRPGRDSGQDA